jgi:hypothetical protein
LKYTDKADVMEALRSMDPDDAMRFIADGLKEASKDWTLARTYGITIDSELGRKVQEEVEKTQARRLAAERERKLLQDQQSVKLAQKLLRQKVSHACVADLTHLSLDEVKRLAADL